MKPTRPFPSFRVDPAAAAGRLAIRRWRAIGAAAIFFALWIGARGELELRGLCVTGEVVQLSFCEAEARQSFGWQRIGDPVDGYLVTGYDRKTETATLTKGAETLRLHLLSGVLLKSRAGEPGMVKGTMTVRGENGRLLTLAADLKFGADNPVDLGGDRQMVITPSKLPDGNFLYLISFINRAGGGQGKLESVPAVVTRPFEAFGLGADGEEMSFTPARP